MLGAIATYQRAFSGRPSPCRFFPSCSEYGREAIEVHGPWRGVWLTTRRLLRCRPLGPSGFDPVPLPRDADVSDDGNAAGSSAGRTTAARRATTTTITRPTAEERR